MVTLSPKKVLQFSFQLGWIENEQSWLAMLNDRNLTPHTYREEYAQEIYSNLPVHLKNMQALQDYIDFYIKDRHNLSS